MARRGMLTFTHVWELGTNTKYRKDWATAGRDMVVRTSGIQTPPLLHAALGGRLESVEFFLSDVPHRLYTEFSKTKQAREDPRLKLLMDAPGGFNRAISKWLGADSKCCSISYAMYQY